jgi:hypothetical protein
VVKQLAAGESQYSISKEIGLKRSAVCRFANREDVRELIQQEQMKLVEVVPDAVENVQDLVREIRMSLKNLCLPAEQADLTAIS